MKTTIRPFSIPNLKFLTRPTHQAPHTHSSICYITCLPVSTSGGGRRSWVRFGGDFCWRAAGREGDSLSWRPLTSLGTSARLRSLILYTDAPAEAARWFIHSGQTGARDGPPNMFIWCGWFDPEAEVVFLLFFLNFFIMDWVRYRGRVLLDYKSWSYENRKKTLCEKNFHSWHTFKWRKTQPWEKFCLWNWYSTFGTKPARSSTVRRHLALLMAWAIFAHHLDPLIH